MDAAYLSEIALWIYSFGSPEGYSYDAEWLIAAHNKVATLEQAYENEKCSGRHSGSVHL
jgi:hypothetical protein